MVSITVIISVYLFYIGLSYYTTSLEERFYHSDHQLLKPNGLYGHGLGIIGTLLIIIGVFGYMARKRMKILSRIWILKHWLEFHIFLCTLGSIMILFHTAFKLGGIVSISFWSMVAVILSGVIGRFIYLQIPRTIQGRELNLNEIRDEKEKIHSVIKNNLPESTYHELLDMNTVRKNKNGFFASYFLERNHIKQIGRKLRSFEITPRIRKEILNQFSREAALNRKIHRLELMQRLFRYWHIAHLPFALIMLIIMVIHVTVALLLGYNWIF
ncbi:MAG TPA: hypothetical protein DCX89_04650 [Saprospirales bacterium]|nr:hypothetical protein [Saprospirales bacterium]HAY71158.1 hypothetical protein [Saprospirales bacterium]